VPKPIPGTEKPKPPVVPKSAPTTEKPNPNDAPKPVPSAEKPKTAPTPTTDKRLNEKVTVANSPEKSDGPNQARRFLNVFTGTLSKNTTVAPAENSPDDESDNSSYEYNDVLDVMGLGVPKASKVDWSFIKELIESVQIQYLDNFQRFHLIVNHPAISYLSFTPQLGYVLGWFNPHRVDNNETAHYGCDLRGGFSSFAVYSKGLTENVIIGNSLSSLLRVVSVTGATPGEYNEKIYDSPIFAKVLPRELNEIEIELRTLDGRLVPFAYGTVMIVLIFKKVINF
jgi:hypothetical protein